MSLALEDKLRVPDPETLDQFAFVLSFINESGDRALLFFHEFDERSPGHELRIMIVIICLFIHVPLFPISEL